MTTTNVYELVGSNGDIIVFDNVHYAVLRDNLEGFSGYPVEMNYISPPGHIGDKQTNLRFTRRVLSLKIATIANSSVNHEAQRVRLIKALNPANGDSTLIWHKSNETSVYIKVVPDNGYPAFTGVDPVDWIREADLDLVAQDPCWYALEELVQYPLRGFTGGFYLPFALPVSFGTVGGSLTITNPGDVPSGCTITVHGRMVTPVITNETTGETITIKQTVDTGEILTITTYDGNRSVTLTDALGNVSNAMHYVTIGSTYWQIHPGENVMQITAAEADTDAVAYVSYVPRYPAQ